MDGLNVNPLTNVSKSMTKIPWFLSLFFALLALWSLRVRQQRSTKWQKIAGSSKPVTPTYENVDLSTLHRAMDEVQQTDSIQTVEDNTIRELLKHPVVQQHIEAEVKQRVQTQANRLAKQEVDNLKREQREEKISKTNAYMDGLESFFMNSINVYAEELKLNSLWQMSWVTLLNWAFKSNEIYTIN